MIRTTGARSVRNVAVAASAFGAVALIAGVVLATTSASAQPSRAVIHGQMLHSYTEIAELVRSASLIVVGETVSSAQVPFGKLPFTASGVHITEVLKGSVSAGATIQILETGGLLAPGPTKGGDALAARSTWLDYEGVPPMESGHRYLLFLQRYEGPILSDGYQALGQFQGTFFVDGDRVQFKGPASELTRGQFATQRAFDGRPLTDLVAEIRKSAQ
jgi:hypothetical protein